MKKIVSLIFLVLTLFSCNDQRQKLINRMKEFELGQYDGEQVSREKIKELEAEIKRQLNIVDQKIEAALDLSVHYKMLASEYMHLEMFGIARDNFAEAIYLNPMNHILHCYAGICSAQLGKATANKEQQTLLYLEAESYYKRSLELNTDYDHALYGLGILYAYELGRMYDAKDLLERLLEVKPARNDVKFALAYVNIRLDYIDEAIALYDRVISESGNKEQRESAVELKTTLMEEIYGAP